MLSQTKENKTGRPKEAFGIFIENLIGFIEMRTGIRNKANPGFYITYGDLSETNRTAVINCGDKYITNRILRELEINQFYLSHIANVDDKHIYITFNEIPIVMSQLRYNLDILLRKLEAEAEDFWDYFTLQRESALMFASKEEKIEIVYLLRRNEEASLFFESAKDNFKIKKDGKQVRLFLDRDTIDDLLGKKNLLASPSKKKKKVSLDVGTAEIETFVYSSKNYREFELLPFNREINKRHVMKLANSINRHGVTSFVTVVITDCIDGVMKKWVVDGQHRLDAFETLGIPVLFTVIKADSKKEIVRLIADLNTNSRKWTTMNFLNAWRSLEIPDYMMIDDYLNSTRLPFGVLLEALSDSEAKKAMDDFHNGDFEVTDAKRGKRHIEYIQSLRYMLPRSYKIYSGLISFFRRIEAEGKYDHEQMKNRVADYKDMIVFATGEGKDTLVRKLGAMYTGELVMNN